MSSHIPEGTPQSASVGWQGDLRSLEFPVEALRDAVLPKAPVELINAVENIGRFLADQSFQIPPYLSDGLPEADFAFPKALTKPVIDAIVSQEFKIVLENPVRWMSSGTPGNEHVRSLIAGIQLALTQLGIPFSQTIVTNKDTFNERAADSNSLRISYHSADRDLIDDPRVIRIKESYLPSYFTFDTTGFSGWSTMANDPKYFEESQRMDGPESFEFVAALRRFLKEKNVSKYAQPESRGAPLDRPYVFYPMQIATDRVMEHSRIPFTDVLFGLVEAAKASGVDLVIKRHPRCNDAKTAEMIEGIALENNSLIHFSNSSIEDLVSHSQAVVVVNSGTGMEALIRGKPVYCVGHSDYHYLAHPINRIDQLTEAFHNPRTRTDPLTEATFINYYFNKYCVNPNNPRAFQFKLVNAILDCLNYQNKIVPISDFH